MGNGSKYELTFNSAEKHLYILSFDRDGTYQRSTEVDPSFRVLRLGMFQSGTLLAFGYDEKSYPPKLAMLKEDGTLLKVLDIPEGNAPGSLRDDRSKVLAPTEIVPEGRSILLVQSGTSFPLLEVSEGGAGGVRCFACSAGVNRVAAKRRDDARFANDEKRGTRPVEDEEG
jgi:hypothetical protein